MATDPRHNELEVHVGWILGPVLMAILLGSCLGALGPTLLALLFVPNVLGVHMLLSWQWALAVLITELLDVQTAAPCIAAFGYCIVGCPYYVLNANMLLRMGVDLPERVMFGWAKWITSNLYNFSDESKLIVHRVLLSGTVTLSYKVVFLQFDLLCHLLPMLISLQRHAHRMTAGTILITGVAFAVWGLLLKRRHLEWVRLYETLWTGRLVFVPAPCVETVREHMQITYIMEPALIKGEQNLGLGVGFLMASVLLFFIATDRHALISAWLALGDLFPVSLLFTIYASLIVTVSITCAVAWWKIFLSGTRDQERASKAK